MKNRRKFRTTRFFAEHRGEVFEKSLEDGAISGYALPERDTAGPFLSCWRGSGKTQ
jgi:hypothetical protein